MEQKVNPSLPADLESQVFGYLDLLEAKDAEAYADAKRKTKVANVDESEEA